MLWAVEGRLVLEGSPFKGGGRPPREEFLDKSRLLRRGLGWALLQLHPSPSSS